MNHLDLSSAFNSIPVTTVTTDLILRQNHSTLHNPNFPSSSNLFSSDSFPFDSISIPSHSEIFNLDHLDHPPPPYTNIQQPPPYQLFEDLIIAEIFRALFHFPDSHPLLSFQSSSSFSQFPDFFLSHSIAFPPRYESTVQSTTDISIADGDEYGRNEYCTIIRPRYHDTPRRVHVPRQGRSCEYPA